MEVVPAADNQLVRGDGSGFNIRTLQLSIDENTYSYNGNADMNVAINTPASVPELVFSGSSHSQIFLGGYYGVGILIFVAADITSRYWHPITDRFAYKLYNGDTTADTETPESICNGYWKISKSGGSITVEPQTGSNYYMRYIWRIRN